MLRIGTAAGRGEATPLINNRHDTKRQNLAFARLVRRRCPGQSVRRRRILSDLHVGAIDNTSTNM